MVPEPSDAFVPGVAVTGHGEIPLARRPDGGVLVEGDTRTVVYRGDAARALLERTTRWDVDTEVILPRNAALQVTVDGVGLHLGEPGAVMVGAGGEARFEQVQGEVIVVQSGKAPDWYEKLSPDGGHKKSFDEIAAINQRIFHSQTRAARFPPAQLATLLQNGIVKGVDDAPDFVEWAPFRESEALRERLSAAGFGERDQKSLIDVWTASKHRGLHGRNSGYLQPSRLTDEDRQGLEAFQLARSFRFGPHDTMVWLDYATEEQLRTRLDRAGLGHRADPIVDVWKDTTRSGYDNSGFVWEKDKVVVYAERGKTNLFNEQASEWIVNSTAYAGENDPFSVGVSRVASPAPLEGPTPFTRLRPAESLHVHPVRDGEKKQTEGYLVLHGRAAMLTVKDGKPEVKVVKAGEMVVMEPGVPHCVMAADGEYEHVAFQVPSAFQYGFMFKENVPFESLGLTQAQAQHMALEALAGR